MKRIEYKTTGTCSRQINIDIDENGIVRNLTFIGGCSGNLQGLSALCIGMKVEDIIDKLYGIKCGFKSTSCPDQLAKALKDNIQSIKETK